jgi:xanthine dehydrogenase YagR molybdenum-binding subunit
MDEHESNPEPSTANIFEITRRTVIEKSKGIGELRTFGAGAAIANAVYSAGGVRIRDYPVTLDKLLSKLPVRS